MYLWRLLLCSGLPCLAYQAPSSDQLPFSIAAFASPPANLRPRFRYWVPDASVDLKVIASDIASAGHVGAGGVELLGYYFYGGDRVGFVPTDWTKYESIQDAALRACKNNDLLLDYALGPNQGAGVPASDNDEGLLWTLQPFNVSIPLGGSFNGTLPGWGSGTLVSASIGLVTKSVPQKFINRFNFGSLRVSGFKKTLAFASLKDVTSQVGVHGHLSIQAPKNAPGIEYRLFAYYQLRSLYKEQLSSTEIPTVVKQSPIKSYAENGSFVVDHFSTRGAQTVIDFWEQHLLANGSRELLAEVGNYAWEDSQEYGAGTTVFWTPDLLRSFHDQHGYDLKRLLPLILYANNGPNGNLSSSTWFVTNEADNGDKHVFNYRETLTSLNQLYLTTLRNWTHTLKNQLSAQVGYNLPLDTQANVPFVDAPELESLDWANKIDAYRQFTGPAHLASKRIISSELGSIFQSTFIETLPQILWEIKRSLVAGINQFVIHGFPYSGAYPNTTWPVFTTFRGEASDMHGPYLPAWAVDGGYKDFLDYIARLQSVAQAGAPKIDLAFWEKKADWRPIDAQYQHNDLEKAGYTYSYISPANFDLPLATVTNSELAESGPAYRALILFANVTLTIPGVVKLLQYAHAGLPIFFLDGIPQNFTGGESPQTKSLSDSLTVLPAQLPNVHLIHSKDLASTLQSSGAHLLPRVQISANGTWYTHLRYSSTPSHSISTLLVYNDADYPPPPTSASKGNITLTLVKPGHGLPSVLDAWNGAQKPLTGYSLSPDKNKITIPLALAGTEAIVLIFNNSQPIATSLLPRATTPQHPPRKSSATESFKTVLSNWTLEIESWSAPPDLAIGKTFKTNYTYKLDHIVPWNQIPASARIPPNAQSDKDTQLQPPILNLANVSGRGYYRTKFTSKQSPTARKLTSNFTLDLGPIFHTAAAYINNQRTPILDPSIGRADITHLVHAGENDVLIIVSTPLGNALRPVYHKLATAGQNLAGHAPPTKPYGLAQDVLIYSPLN